MSRKTTYTRLTAKIILSTLFLSLLIAFFYGEFMKKEAIEKFAQVDAKKTSQLVFESLYSAMEKGWDKDDLFNIINRINQIEEDMVVNVYRSKAVGELYGDIEKDAYARENLPEVKQAFLNKEILNIKDNFEVEYFYPITAKANCLACHSNSKEGDILGVIDIKYPITELKISLNDMVNFFIIFVVSFSFIVFLALFLEFDKYLLKPIKNFVVNLHLISEERDISKRIDIKNDIEEINSMQNVFNKMLDTLEYQFYNDELTNLPNRKKLIEDVANKDFSTLIIFNIDRFQEINDLYNETIGNNILKEVATLLTDSIQKEEATVYKLHADEYALHCKKSLEEDEIKSLTTYLIDTIQTHKFEINNEEIYITITAGISFGEKALLSNADIALKIAKKNKKRFLIYDTSMDAEFEYSQNITWTKKIKDAIKTDRIVPLFQPIVDTKTEKVVKYESLIRMKDEDGEYISPIHFLELAKKNKLYHELTRIMIEKSFETFKNLECDFSINLSVEDILNKKVEKLIYKKLEETGIGQRVVFEIIESEGIENFEEVIDFIDSVKKYNCKISIDDFGTGYSNFEYLMKLKVDYIKIDASMIKHIDIDKNSELVTETIIDFAKKMNLKTIGEFVHSRNIYDKIKEIGIDYAQGYYLGEPKEL